MPYSVSSPKMRRIIENPEYTEQRSLAALLDEGLHERLGVVFEQTVDLVEKIIDARIRGQGRARHQRGALTFVASA